MPRHVFMTFSDKTMRFLTEDTEESQALKELLSLLVKLNIINSDITVQYNSQMGTLRHTK